MKNTFSKKLTAVFFAVVSVFAFSCKTVPAGQENSSIVVLYTNDVHCGVEDAIGYAGLELYKKQMLKETPYVTLVDAGDAIQGATFGNISKGENIVKIMNKMNYDVAVPGNHEFDYGMKQFMKLSKFLKCGYVSSNFRMTKNGKLVFPAYKIIKYGKKKVAYVGVSTPETFTKSTPAYFQDAEGNFAYSFGGENEGKKIYADVQEAIDSARGKGADYVVLVAHLGNSDITAGWTSSDIIANVSGADVLLDGHSHEVIPAVKVQDKSGKDVIVSQTGTKLNHIGKLVITSDGAISTELVDSVADENGNTRDAEMSSFIESIKNEFEATLAKKIAHTDFVLSAVDEKGDWLVRTNQTNLGDLVTDAIKWHFKSDVALMNGGGLRANIKPGDITYNDALTVLPFGNKLYMSEVKGQVLLDELEYAVRMLPAKSGGFFHVAGMTFKIDTSIPSSTVTDENKFFAGVNGAYRIHDVLINGQPLDVEKMYKVGSIDYVLKNEGDGHIFAGSKMLVDDPTLVCDALADYISSFGGNVPASYKESQNRIVIE